MCKCKKLERLPQNRTKPPGVHVICYHDVYDDTTASVHKAAGAWALHSRKQITQQTQDSLVEFNDTEMSAGRILIN